MEVPILLRTEAESVQRVSALKIYQKNYFTGYL